MKRGILKLSALSFLLLGFATMTQVTGRTRFEPGDHPQKKEKTAQDTVILTVDGKEKGKRVIVYVNDGNSHPEKDSVTVNCFYYAGDSVQKLVSPHILSPDQIKRMVIMKNGPGPSADAVVPQWSETGRSFSVTHDPFAFDTTDPDIISYKKKDVGKDQEKIIIIRKKKEPQKEVKEVEVRVVK
jgi:hypothetical protein